MKIVITGAGGQLAYSLRHVLSAEGHTLYMLGRTELDVTDAAKAKQIICSMDPDAVVHCAAFTQVDQAERDPGAAYEVNAIGTRNVAEAAASCNAVMTYISSDYVFDGNKGAPYTEADIPNPVNVYGSSKYYGEKFVDLLCQRRFIMRTAWLYGSGGDNFVKSVLALARKGEPVRAAWDQIGSPTNTDDLARFIAELLQTKRYGLYHTANRGFCTRYEWVAAILNAAGLSDTPIISQQLAEFRFAAQRPWNTSLDDANIRRRKLPRFREWLPALEEYVAKECMQIKLRKEKDDD